MLGHPRAKEPLVSLARRSWFIAVSLLASLLLLADIAVAATPTKVLSTSRNEFDGTAENGYLAYARSRAGKPNKLDAYLKRPGLARIKVNAAGTQGYHPNLDIGNATFGDSLVFVQKGAGDADLKIWDVDSGGRRNPPAGVNTQAGESKPSLDGDWLLFGRGPAKKFYMTKVILFDLLTNTPTVIDTAPTNGIVYPGIVNGDWATWTECSPSDCRAWRYEISTTTKTEVPSSARFIYTSAIDTDGTVWFVQSGFGCGANVKIRRHVIASAPTTLVDFPPGIDANISDLDDSPATDRLYFARVNCSNVNNWNIYRVAADA
jgi:hypothetical protein